MAMTLDDVVAVANALRTEASLGLAQVVGAIQAGAADVVSVGNALRTEVALGIARLAGPAPTTDMPSAFDRPQPVIIVGPRPLPVSGMPGSGGGPKAPGPDPGAFDKTAALLGKLAKGAGDVQSSLTNFLGVFDKALASLGGGMSKFVSLANPAAVYKFNLAIENAQSAIGRVLVPVMERFTGIVQQLGNAIESLSPETKRLAGGLAAGGGLAGVFAAVAAAGSVLLNTVGRVPLLIGTLVAAVAGVVTATSSGQEIMQSFGKVIQAVSAVVEVLARTLLPVAETVLVPLFLELSTVLLDAAEAVRSLTNAARALIGLSPLDNKADKTAVAVRTGGIGDLRGLANRAYTSAYNSGTASLAQSHFDEAKKQTGVLEQIRDRLPNIGSGLKGPGKVNGTDVGAGSSLERFGRWVGGDRGASVGRGVGGIGDAAAAPFILVPRTLARMAGMLE